MFEWPSKTNRFDIGSKFSLSSSSCRKCSRKVLTTVESFLFIQNSVNKTVERRVEIINIKRCANSPCATRQQERKKTRTQTRKCLDYDVDPSCNDLNESIQNLMNLPVEEDDKSLVKVRLTYCTCECISQIYVPLESFVVCFFNFNRCSLAYLLLSCI